MLTKALFFDQWWYVTSCWDVVPEGVVHTGSSQACFLGIGGEGGSDDASTDDRLFLV